MMAGQMLTILDLCNNESNTHSLNRPRPQSNAREPEKRLYLCNDESNTRSLHQPRRQSNAREPGKRKRHLPYNLQEMRFVFYHRFALDLDWDNIVPIYNS